MSKFTVVRDTREQLGWSFSPGEHCNGTIDDKLDTGDYALQGFESQFVIERKASTAEFANNVTDDRFERELSRMDNFPLSFLICEFTYEDLAKFPAGSGIPKIKWEHLRVTAPFLIKRLHEIEVYHKCKVVLAGNNAAAYAFDLMRKAEKWLRKS